MRMMPLTNHAHGSLLARAIPLSPLWGYLTLSPSGNAGALVPFHIVSRDNPRLVSRERAVFPAPNSYYQRLGLVHLSDRILRDTMASLKAILTGKAPKPIPQLSQAVKYNGMVYCSGSLGIDPVTSKLVDGTVQDRTVLSHYTKPLSLSDFYCQKLTLGIASSPQEPGGSPGGGREQPRQRGQGQRLLDQHEQLRCHERGLR